MSSINNIIQKALSTDSEEEAVSLFKFARKRNANATITLTTESPQTNQVKVLKAKISRLEKDLYSITMAYKTFKLSEHLEEMNHKRQIKRLKEELKIAKTGMLLLVGFLVMAILLI